MLALSGNFSVFAANMPILKSWFNNSDSAQDLASLNQGEIVFFKVAESDEKELAVGLLSICRHSRPKLLVYQE